jgi:hypothetical protein
LDDEVLAQGFIVAALLMVYLTLFGFFMLSAVR